MALRALSGVHACLLLSSMWELQQAPAWAVALSAVSTSIINFLPHAVPVTAAMTSQKACLRAAVMPVLQELAPSHAQIHATLDLFPGLTALDLSGLHFCARLLLLQVDCMPQWHHTPCLLLSTVFADFAAPTAYC